MERTFGEYTISDDKEKIQLDRVCALLGDTYWASGRPKERIAKSIGSSLCFGVYLDGRQVGFARCVTDYATMYWLADVIIDSSHRNRGLGKALVESAVNHERLQGCVGILGTRDAHTLYEKYGFLRFPDRFMSKPAG